MLPLLHLQPSNITHITYQLSNYSEKSQEVTTKFINKTRLFRNKEKERNRQLREFNIQLFDFLELIEKEYNKKNGIKP